MSSPLQIGDLLPPFILQNQERQTVTEKDLLGSHVILYFYPKDDTPGCTKQACSFRDAHDSFTALGIKIFGISADSAASHKKFQQKYNLPFTLLCDPDKATAHAWGLMNETLFFGKLVNKVTRTMLLLDPTGKIIWMEKAVHVEGHLERLQQVIQEKVFR